MTELLENKVKIVAKNIREIRESKKYTQEYLAAKLRISQNAYSKIELGYSRLTVNRLIQIAEILDVEIINLLCFDRSEFIKSLPSTEKPPKYPIRDL